MRQWCPSGWVFRVPETRILCELGCPHPHPLALNTTMLSPPPPSDPKLRTNSPHPPSKLNYETHTPNPRPLTPRPVNPNQALQIYMSSTWCWAGYTRNPNLEPGTLNPHTYTSNPKPQLPNSKPLTLHPKPSHLHFKPQLPNPKPQPPNPRP